MAVDCVLSNKSGRGAVCSYGQVEIFFPAAIESGMVIFLARKLA